MSFKQRPDIFLASQALAFHWFNEWRYYRMPQRNCLVFLRKTELSKPHVMRAKHRLSHVRDTSSPKNSAGERNALCISSRTVGIDFHVIPRRSNGWFKETSVVSSQFHFPSILLLRKKGERKKRYSAQISFSWSTFHATER